MVIKAIIFDCFGVLTGDLWKEFVAQLPEDQQRPARDLNHALDRGIIDRIEFADKVHELSGVPAVQISAIITAEMEKNQPLLNYIATLKPKYTIGLLSNVSSNWIQDTLLSADDVQLFSDMVLSYQVGMIKPDPKLYKLTAERLGYPPDQCVLIDDGLGNCQGAEAVGMKAVLYKDFVQFKHDLEQVLTEADK